MCAGMWSKFIRRRPMKKRFASNFSATKSMRSRASIRLTGHPHESLGMMTFFPAKQFVTPADKLNRALRTIRAELDDRIIGSGRAGETARGAAAENAHGIRSRDVAGDGFLQRHRKLFATSLRSRAWLEAIHACSIFSRRIFCSWSTNRTPRFRRSAACTKATSRARPCWSNTVSACRARSITGR